MDPNKWGLIRQKELNLVALPLLIQDFNLSEYEIEQINLEYQENLAYNGTNANSPSTSTTNKIGTAEITNKYDFLILPAGVSNGSAYSGISIMFNGSRGIIKGAWFSNPNDVSFSYYIFKTVGVSYDMINVTLPQEYTDLPALGLIRHRSDNVNPKGIIKDVNSDLLQPVKKDELNGEADRIRDELPGNTESPDLDSKSGSGAEERTGS